MVDKEKVTVMRNMADGLQELQLQLEPVRDKALDQKAFYTGYAQCAEQMIKVIVGRMNALREQAVLQENGEEEEKVEEEVVEEEKMEAPLIVDEKPKTKKKKTAKEA